MSETVNGPEHEGERYLRMLGLEHIADQPIAGSDLQGRDFLQICGEHALPILTGLERLDPDDPRFDAVRDMLRSSITQYIQPPSAES